MHWRDDAQAIVKQGQQRRHQYLRPMLIVLSHLRILPKGIRCLTV
jgi:hypothetical protein